MPQLKDSEYVRIAQEIRYTDEICRMIYTDGIISDEIVTEMVKRVCKKNIRSEYGLKRIHEALCEC